MQHYKLLISLVFSAAVGLGGAARAAGFSDVEGTGWQAKKSSSSTTKSGKARNARKGKGSITFNDGSAESRSERDRRLKRECKGRSNSGVCEGYTR